VVGVSKPAAVLLRIDPQSMFSLLTYSLFLAQDSLRPKEQNTD
jgi:hypothetical protein